MSLGTDRVRLAFNPSANSQVDNLKGAAAGFIDACAAGFDDTRNPEARRLWSLAMTHMEDAAMWAVKAATIPNGAADAPKT
jgi:hypothetical protein